MWITARHFSLFSDFRPPFFLSTFCKHSYRHIENPKPSSYVLCRKKKKKKVREKDPKKGAKPFSRVCGENKFLCFMISCWMKLNILMPYKPFSAHTASYCWIFFLWILLDIVCISNLARNYECWFLGGWLTIWVFFVVTCYYGFLVLAHFLWSL